MAKRSGPSFETRPISAVTRVCDALWGAPQDEGPCGYVAPHRRARYVCFMRDETHFGSRTVPLDEKQALVDDVFHKVARRYDLILPGAAPEELR